MCRTLSCTAAAGGAEMLVCTAETKGLKWSFEKQGGRDYVRAVENSFLIP